VITAERILFLRHVDLFSTVPVRALGRLARSAEEVVYPSGTTIFRRGDPSDSLFLIVEGEVRVHRDDVELNRLGPKGNLGEMSIVDGAPRSASATAAVDCLLLRIRQTDVYELLATHFEATLAVVRHLSRRIREKEDAQFGGAQVDRGSSRKEDTR